MARSLHEPTRPWRTHGDGSLVVAGYVLSGETQRELDELDLAELDPARLERHMC